MALEIIFKEGKEIRWKGLPSTDVKVMEQNKVGNETPFVILMREPSASLLPPLPLSLHLCTFFNDARQEHWILRSPCGNSM